MTTSGSNNSNGNGNGRYNNLIMWLLGALLTALTVMSGIAHSAIMRQQDDTNKRIERVENILLKR